MSDTDDALGAETPRNPQWQPGRPITLRGETLALRSIMPRDVDDRYLSWWGREDAGDDEDGSGSEGKRSLGRPQAVRHVRRFDNRRRFHLAILPSSTSADGEYDPPVGFTSLFLEPGRRATPIIRIAEANYKHKGIEAEVLEIICRFAFARLNMAKVYTRVSPNAFDVIAAHLQLGFSVEGILRDHTERRGFGRVDTVFFGLLRPEWRSRRTEQTDDAQGRESFRRVAVALQAEAEALDQLGETSERLDHIRGLISSPSGV